MAPVAVSGSGRSCHTLVFPMPFRRRAPSWSVVFSNSSALRSAWLSPSLLTTTASADSSPALVGEVSPGKVHVLSTRAARLYQSASFGDSRISRSLARSSPTPGLSACSCSYGRVFASPFFQPGLAASALGFATLLVTLCGYHLSDNKYMPMPGTLGRAVPDTSWRAQPALPWVDAAPGSR